MNTTSSRWRFFRAGGFDQVRLDTADELLAIGGLDQKLWVALACPVKGIEFDQRTLSFVDSDADGYVRAPELIAAVQWAGARLLQPEVLAQKLPGVPMAAIRGDDAAGQAIVTAAQALWADGGAVDDLITVEAAAQAVSRQAERALQAWTSSGESAQILGDASPVAYAAWQAVREKIDDWFVRCRLSAFDARAEDALNASGEAFAAMAMQALRTDSQAIAALPLSRVDAGAALPLQTGVNPAWSARIQTFAETVAVPLLGARTELTAADWTELQQRWAPYEAWLAAQPDPAAQGDGLRELEQLARYVRDLMTLANNFVAFRDFYARQGKASFQIGTLYLDGRSCELCVSVSDAARHAALASLARICLVYVDCVRGAEKMSVAAAFTAGDSDQLMVGRNGVFYDRQGRDWNATITKMVEHPISLRQAFWSPYKRLARLVSEQLQKMAASKAKASDDQMAVLAQGTAKKVEMGKAAPAPAPTAFDVGKFAGIFAAIGLAVGALGTALASMVTGLFALQWWQMPLALAGLLLAVSGPAMVVAWFKLRSRNLGPILDANGWAVNARARINIPFGTSLTELAQLPPNAERSLIDPYAEKKTPWALYLVLLALLLVGVLAWSLVGR